MFTDDVGLKLDGDERVVVNAKDPSRTFVARFTVQPGAHFPWHTHPGPVIVNVTQGQLGYAAADDCVGRSYPAGTASVDPGHGQVHTAYGPTGAPTVLVATFFEAPAAPAPLSSPRTRPTTARFESPAAGCRGCHVEPVDRARHRAADAGGEELAGHAGGERHGRVAHRPSAGSGREFAGARRAAASAAGRFGAAASERGGGAHRRSWVE